MCRFANLTDKTNAKMTRFLTCLVQQRLQTTASSVRLCSSLFLNVRRMLSSLSISRTCDTSIDLEWKSDTESVQTGTFHYAWLRDNCQCPRCVHASTRQKLHSSADVASGVKPVSCRVVSTGGRPALAVSWPTASMRPVVGNASTESAHESTYDLAWLSRYNYTNQPKPSILTLSKPPPVLWDAPLLKERRSEFDYSQITTDANAFRRFLREMHDFGVCILRNVPTQDHRQVERVANLFGCIRKTFYGKSWDVRSVPNAKNVAYTSLHLGLHMDLMYFEAPPGLQFLHCLETTVTGGSSTFVDVYRVVDEFKKNHPQHYNVLTKVPVTFHYINDGHHMHYRRPTIVDNDPTDGLRVYYAPPFQGPLEPLECPDLVDAFYAAFKAFEDAINDPRMVFETMLQKGDCAVFANRRVLHGRLAFDASSGTRHLKGTYVDLDDFKDKLRVNGLLE